MGASWEKADPAVREILEKYRPVWAMEHSLATLSWDTETGMPEAGATGRGIASGQLAMMYQRAALELKGPVTRAAKSKDLDDREKGVVRVLKRSIDYYEKIPPELVDKLQRVTTEATVVWRKARKNSDFKLFAPHLQKILDLKREEADKLGYKQHRYNALLDLYDEGMTVKDADSVFSRLVPGVKKIMEKVQSQGLFPSKHPLESVRYETSAMTRLSEETLRTLKMPGERFKMAISTHPFCTTISPDDVRITTRYEGRDFKSSLFAVMHECGHAMYELGVAKDLQYTPIFGGASLGIHESQSRFWENAVGRSKPYAKLAYPTIRKSLPFVSKYTSDELYLYFNTVRTSMIRVEADELTYNLHIALRYEIEKRMIEGKVAVSELPALWNDLFDEYLGTRPKKDSEGVLQDVHWGGGSIGYFPTYTLGNVVLGMIWHKMDDGRQITDAIRKRDLVSLRTWLGTNIHRWGQTYSPKQLLERTFGETYNPEWLLKYLSDKYLEN
ncbi:MAG: carboxypeptidase M32 [Thaumarchaeota archaeon]|nr:carboxypeptidase M32 [Nitrososphaerota archaeon]